MNEELSSGLAAGLVDHLQRLASQSRALSQAQEKEMQRMKKKRQLRQMLATEMAKEAALARAKKLRIGSQRKEDERTVFVGTVADLLNETRRERWEFMQKQHGEKAKEKIQDELMLTVSGALRDRDKLSDFIESGTKESVTRRQMVNNLIAYRLSGVSLFRTQALKEEERLIGLRFDTSHKGKIFERFYAILAPEDDSTEEPLTLFRHTLPHFIAAEEIFQKNDLNGFVRLVQGYLNAFVSRREETKSLLASLEERGPLSHESSAAHDRIKLFTGERAKKAEVVVEYGSLLERIPSTVSISCKYGSDTLDLRNGLVGIDFVLSEFVHECIENMFPAKKKP